MFTYSVIGSLTEYIRGGETEKQEATRLTREQLCTFVLCHTGHQTWRRENIAGKEEGSENDAFSSRSLDSSFLSARINIMEESLEHDLESEGEISTMGSSIIQERKPRHCKARHVGYRMSHCYDSPPLAINGGDNSERKKKPETRSENRRIERSNDRDISGMFCLPPEIDTTGSSIRYSDEDIRYANVIDIILGSRAWDGEERK